MKAVIFAHNYEYPSYEAVLKFEQQCFDLMRAYKIDMGERLFYLMKGCS